jgi:hypothetical protein
LSNVLKPVKKTRASKTKGPNAPINTDTPVDEGPVNGNARKRAHADRAETRPAKENPKKQIIDLQAQMEAQWEVLEKADDRIVAHEHARAVRRLSHIAIIAKEMEDSDDGNESGEFIDTTGVSTASDDESDDLKEMGKTKPSTAAKTRRDDDAAEVCWSDPDFFNLKSDDTNL